MTAVFCIVGIVLAAGVGVALWQLVLWVQKQQKGRRHHHHSVDSGGSDGPNTPGDYHPPAPRGLSVTPLSDTALRLQFNSVPTLLVTQYNVVSIQVPGSGNTACPTAWPKGPVNSLQTVPQVYTKPGDSQPVSTVITGLLPNTAYCTYVQSLGELHGGQYVGTTNSVVTGSGPPGPPAPSDTVTLSITYQPPGPAPFYMPPVLMATLSPVQDPTPYTLTWYCNEEMTASGSFAQKQQNLVVTDGDWYATVTCEGPTCPINPVAPSNTITVKLPSS